MSARGTGGLTAADLDANIEPWRLPHMAAEPRAPRFEQAPPLVWPTIDPFAIEAPPPFPPLVTEDWPAGSLESLYVCITYGVGILTGIVGDELVRWFLSGVAP